MIQSPYWRASQARFEPGQGLVAASSTSRLIRAAGSEAERARSHVAAVASARATLSARASSPLEAGCRPCSSGVLCTHDSRFVPSCSVHRSIQQGKRDRMAIADAAIVARIGQIGLAWTDR